MRARLVCLAVAALSLALPAASAEALTFPSPYGSGAHVAVNASGMAVVAWTGPNGVRATTGDRPSGFAAPTTLAGSAAGATPPRVAIDDAGTAIVVWETTRLFRPANCGRYCDGRRISTGVWASLRPAGGAFAPPVALARPQSDKGTVADPRLAVSANGHAVVAWTAEDGVTASLRGPGGPMQPAQPVAAPPFSLTSVAVTDAGEVLVGGTLGQLVVRPPNGSFAPPRTFLGAAPVSSPVLVAADARGDAAIAYPASTGGFLLAQRPAQGDWGALTPLRSAPGASLRASAMTAGGEAVVRWTEVDRAIGSSAGVVVAIAHGAATPAIRRITPPDGGADGSFDGAGLGAGAGADVVAAWDRQGVDITARRVAQVSIRRAGGAFAAPITLTPSDGDHVVSDYPDVDTDAGGWVLAAWVDHHPGESRVKAIWLGADRASAPTVLETAATPDAAPVNIPPDHFASVVLSPALKPTRRGFVGVPLTCFSTDGQVCEGTITLRQIAGKVRAGRARFKVASGRPKRVFIGLGKRTRSRLRRHSMVTMIATVANTKPGGGAGRRTSDGVFVAGSRRKQPR